MKETYPILKLTNAEKTELESWIRSGKTDQRYALRAKVVLLNSEGLSAVQISKELTVTRRTIYKWVKRFAEQALLGLKDAPRSGQPRKLSKTKVKEVLQMTTKYSPKESTHWSIRLMAKEAGISNWQVQQIWKEAGLKPHLIRSFKISKDPDFAEKVVDVVGLYLNPPVNAVVLSVDEKTQIQALDRTQPMLPMRPGQIERRTHDYKRNGVTNLYAAFDLATGKVMGRVTKRHRAKEFLDFLKQINRNTWPGHDLHIILDNSSTHKTEEVRKWLEKNKRFKLHFTPTSASWLNAVEGWFSSLERRSLYRGVFTSIKELRDEIHRFIKVHNQESAKPFRWTKNSDEIIKKHEKVKMKILGTN